MAFEYLLKQEKENLYMKYEKFRRDVLDGMKSLLDEMEITNMIREADEVMPMPMLTTLHRNLGMAGNEVMGQFYFLPLLDEEQPFHFFTSVLTLDEEVPAEKYEDLAMAATMLNFYLPAGSFVVEKDGGVLAYKSTNFIPVNTSLEDALVLADANMGIAFNLTDAYVDAFMQLLHNEITLEQFELELPEVHFGE